MIRFLKWGSVLLGILVLLIVILLLVFKIWASGVGEVRKQKIEVLRNFPVPEKAEFIRMQESGIPDSTPTTMFEYKSSMNRSEIKLFYESLLIENNDWQLNENTCNNENYNPCGFYFKIPDLKNDVSVMIYENGSIAIRSSIAWPY